MRPLAHRPGVIARQQAPAHEHAQQPPAHACLYVGDGVGIEPGGGMEDDPARDGRGDAGRFNSRERPRGFKAAFRATYIRGSPFRLTQIVGGGGGPFSCMWCSRPSK